MDKSCKPLSFSSIATLIVLCTGLLGGVAAAAEDRDFAPSAAADFDPAEHGLAANPLVVKPLGLAMYVPEGSVSTDRAGGQLVVTLNDSSPSPAWRITIQHLHTAPGTTPEDQIEQHLAALEAGRREHEVIENRRINAGNAQGRLCYIHQKTSGEDAVITGWLILPASPNVFLVMSILATPERLATLRPVLEAGFSTINLRSAAELSLERRSRMESGRALLESITPEQLRSLLGTRQWARIHRVDSQGAEREVGYSLLEVYEAKRGQLHPERSEADYSRTERTEGIMVRLQGRIIGDADRGIFFDSLALYWMAWDQSEEAWTVRGTQRQGEAERSESETGLRLAPSVGNPQPRLSVIRQRSADYQRDPHDWIVPDVYLSQSLGALLGRLMPRDADEPREYSYYFYNYSQQVPQLTTRFDRWEPAADDSGKWTLTTRLSVDAPPIISTYSSSGEFLRTVRGDGTVTTPSSIERIRQIWQRQGLPMGQ